MMKLATMTATAYLISSAGILVHLYLTMALAGHEPSLLLIIPAMNSLPYILCIMLTRITGRPLNLICAGLLLLASDAYFFKGLLLGTDPMRKQMVECYQIIFKLAVVVPFGYLVGISMSKVFCRNADR
jgi:hypothetical protein